MINIRDLRQRVIPPRCARQYLVELLSSPSYGNATVGGVKLSEWLSDGMTVDTLFSGLFRPVPVVRQRLELISGQVYTGTRDLVSSAPLTVAWTKV